MYQVGNLLERGQGCPRDLSAAVEWYRRAAGKDQAHALLRLGLFHRDGRGGLEKSRTEARRFLERAAFRGLAEAQYQLACLLVDDTEAEADHSMAEDWFRRAARQGHPKACYMAGCLAEIRAYQGDLAARAEVAEWFRTDKARMIESEPIVDRALAGMFQTATG